MRKLDAAVLALACSALVALPGCMTPPHARPLPVIASQGYVPGGSPRLEEADGAVPARWWAVFGVPQLDALVEAAHDANPGLHAARATLRQAQEQALAQRAALFPSVDLQYTPSRTKLAGNQAANAPGLQGDGSTITGYQGTPAAQGGTAPFNGPVTYTYHTSQLNVGFQPDLFGVLRGQSVAAAADADLQRFEFGAARIALEANVVGAAIQDALLRRQIGIVEHQQASAHRQLELSLHQQRAGYISRGDLAGQQVAAAQFDAALPPLRRQLAQNQDLLRALCGLAQDHALPEFDLDAFKVPPRLPLLVPAELVAHRPDVRAAAAAFEAASTRAGVAVRAQLPQLSITGSLGGAASRFDQMFSASGTFFELSANLVQPLFRGGALKHQAAAARAAADAAEAQYRSSVLGAFQSVADVLQALDSDRPALEAADAAARAAREALAVSERRVASGDTDLLNSLDASLQRDQSELVLQQARANRLSDATALFVALGGDFDQEDSQR